MTSVGDRIVLLRCDDEHTKLEPGERGTVTLIDSLGTVHVAWDSGSSLGLVPGVDEWREEASSRTCMCGMWPIEKYGERCPPAG